MKSLAAPQEHSLVHSYGSKELKEKMENNTLHAFLITNIFLSLLFIIMMLRPAIPIPKIDLPVFGGHPKPPVTTVYIEYPKPPALPQNGSNSGDATPATGTKTVAGNYNAVQNLPDSLINRKIATFGENPLSLATSGTAIIPVRLNTGSNGGGLDLSSGSRNKVVEVYEVNDVEVNPDIDLAQLSRLIVYPREAKDKGIEGLVKVKVLVGEDGVAKRAVIEEAADDLLNAAAISAVLKAKYTPAKQNKYNVACWLSVPINFSLKK